MPRRLAILSDIHLASSGPLCNFHAHAALAGFLRAHAHADTTLIFNGDTFDLLQDANRPRSLALPTAPERLRGFLMNFLREPDGALVLDALHSALHAGTECVILPGNHDLELFHPRCRSILLEAMGLPELLPNLILHTSADPYRTSVGRWQVTVGHGHRGDGWNDADPQTLHRALASGDLNTPLPPGSRLVVDVLRSFALAIDPTTGQPRFPFIDLLKPELPAVPLLLLYLDPRLALAHLPHALGLTAASLVRALRQWLTQGPTLGPMPAYNSADPSDELASYLFEALEAGERASPLHTCDQLATWLAGYTAAPTVGTLADHGGIGRVLLRAFLRRASYDNTFFDRQGQSDIDRAIIKQFLPEASGPHIVLAGHTHAAREIRLPIDRFYLNTGTWTDLMALPLLNDSSAIRRLVNELEAGRIVRRRHLTYAEVTAEGPALHEWPAAASVSA